jgi:hypothetical protein
VELQNIPSIPQFLLNNSIIDTRHFILTFVLIITGTSILSIICTTTFTAITPYISDKSGVPVNEARGQYSCNQYSYVWNKV